MGDVYYSSLSSSQPAVDRLEWIPRAQVVSDVGLLLNLSYFNGQHNSLKTF